MTTSPHVHFIKRYLCGHVHSQCRCIVGTKRAERVALLCAPCMTAKQAARTVPMLDVQYSCTDCGMRDVHVSVPCRASSDSVLTWMKDLGILLSDDHNRRSPDCHPTTLHEIKIPIDVTAGWIGGPPQPETIPTNSEGDEA